MTDIVVVSDTDFSHEIASKEIADRIGILLCNTYPGRRWRIEPHPHATDPGVVVRLENATYVKVTTDRFGVEHRQLAPVAGNLNLREHYSSSSLDAAVVRLGGELLELANLTRGRMFDFAEWMTLPRDPVTGLLVLPTM